MVMSGCAVWVLIALLVVVLVGFDSAVFVLVAVLVDCWLCAGLFQVVLHLYWLLCWLLCWLCAG